MVTVPGFEKAWFLMHEVVFGGSRDRIGREKHVQRPV
jgi:hypothetical protein